ncbi:MAG: metal ABC transporter solute-binding protein, Zn/Mn family [Candidatus Omnitrophota bacterium]
MKRNFKFIVISLVLFTGFTGFAWISFGEEKKTEKLTVVSTIGQINDIVHNIGAEDVYAIGLMGPGVDPHLYKATESDVGKLTEADVIFFNGLFLEAKMEHIFEKLERQKLVVGVADHFPKERLLESEAFKNHYDPHVWFDVTLWKMAAEQVRDTLMKADPRNSEKYKKRAEQYLKDLEQLDQYVFNKASELPEGGRILVTAHDAFRYFGKRYGFEVVGLQGVSTESQAGAADVIRLAKFIADKRIRSIFVESSVPVRNIQAVVEAVKSNGWDVRIGGELFSDAMGDQGTFEGTYIGMVTHNINTIVESLKE